jgi:hypothetical protein
MKVDHIRPRNPPSCLFNWRLTTYDLRLFLPTYRLTDWPSRRLYSYSPARNRSIASCEAL